GGYINQVIKTGTFPGYAQGDLGIGTPGFYHKAGVEAGGATPDRLFSWYVGLQGTNQTFNTLDDNNGSSQPYDGSGPNGIFSSYYNPVAGVFSQTGIGPWSTCGANGAPKGAATFNIGIPVAACNAYAPWAGSGFLGLPWMVQDRENVLNFHFGIPHHNDAGKDDVQLLYYNFAYHQDFGGAINFQGGLPYLNNVLSGWGGPGGLAALFGVTPYNGENGPYSNLCGYNAVLFGPAAGCATTGDSPLRYDDTHIFAPGTTFGQSTSNANTIVYSAPSQGNHPFQSGINPNNLDTTWNDGSVIKLQYQKNFGSTAFVRVMGYSFYSDWLQSSANFAGQFVTGWGYISAGADYPAPDYELDTHTRGIQLEASDQVNAQNLVTFTGNYTTANSVRWNNQWYSAPSHPTNFVDGAGNCYSLQTGAPSNCLLSSTGGTYSHPTGQFLSGSTPVTYQTNNPCAQTTGTTGNPALIGSAACKAGATTIVTVPQGYGTLNTVVPQFASAALQDEWRPDDHWDINAGVRFESYVYQFPSSVNSEYNFWFKQAQNGYCYDPGTGQPVLIPLPPGSSPSSAGPIIAPNTPGSGELPGLCYQSPGVPLLAPSGKQALHPNGQNGSMLYTNNGPSGASHPFWSPRIGGTYTFNPDSVLRFNYGVYTQPTQTAF